MTLSTISKTMTFKNTLSHIILPPPFLGINGPKTTLATHFLWTWQMTPMQNFLWKIRPTMLSTFILMKYPDIKFCPDFSMNVNLVLGGWTVIFGWTYPTQYLRTENNLKIFKIYFSDFNIKLTSLEKLSSLQDLSYSTCAALYLAEHH